MSKLEDTAYNYGAKTRIPIEDKIKALKGALRWREEVLLLRAENDRLREALEKIANTYDDSWRVGSQERRIGDLARAALAKEMGQ